MDETYVSMQVHNEYAKRVEEENKRQNYRLELLEKATEENSKLVISIERLTTSVRNMVEEQKKQGERLETLEKRDGEAWRKFIGYISTTIIGIVIGYILKQIGIF